MSVIYFTSAKRLITGFEGERARRRRVKTSQCDVFSERADETLPAALNPSCERNRLGTAHSRLSAQKSLKTSVFGDFCYLILNTN